MVGFALQNVTLVLVRSMDWRTGQDWQQQTYFMGEILSGYLKSNQSYVNFLSVKFGAGRTQGNSGSGSLQEEDRVRR